MNLPTEVFGSVVVAHTPEELSGDKADELLACVDRLDRRQVVLDLDSTEVLDSAGLSALLDVQDSLRDAGGQLRIATTNRTNRKILEITRLDRHLDVFDSVLDAVKSFR
jgi:anti-anti-sigma factor